jgi:hypothetical protein
MGRHLQIVLTEHEFESSRAAAEERNLTISEWACEVLREAARGTAAGDSNKRIEAIRRATHYSFPAPDMDQMLAELESGTSNVS